MMEDLEVKDKTVVMEQVIQAVTSGVQVMESEGMEEMEELEAIKEQKVA